MPLTPNGQGGYTTTAPIKSYIARLFQHTHSATSGLLIIGNKYIINTLQTGDDFTNVGYTAPNTEFTATGTTPTDWTHNTVVFNNTTSAPTATEFQNTIGDIVWTRVDKGYYRGTLAGAFPDTKTWILNTDDSSNRCVMFPISSTAINAEAWQIYIEDSNTIAIQVWNASFQNADLWSFTSFINLPEIRVYP